MEALAALRQSFVTQLRSIFNTLSKPPNTTAFFQNTSLQMVDSMAEWLIQSIPTKLTGRKQCLSEVLQSHIVSATLDSIAQNFTNLWKVQASASRLESWYQTSLVQGLAGFVPQNQCVDALLELTCARCWKNIPPLCRDACNAHIEGCYSPFYIGLREQFNILWNVTRQLVVSAQSSLREAYASAPAISDIPQDLVGLSNLVSQVVCYNDNKKKNNGTTGFSVDQLNGNNFHRFFDQML